MKILHVIQRYHPAIGGAEVWCRGLSRYLVSQGCGVKVLTIDVYNEDEFWKDPPPENCPVRLGVMEYDRNVLIRRYKRTKIRPVFYRIFENIFDKFLNIYFYGPHSMEMYVNLLKEVRDADIVHLHTIPYPHNFIAFFFARFCRKSVVITPHFHPGHKFYERPSNYWLLKKCDAVFSVTEYEKEHLVRNGVSEDKITVSANALHVEDYKNSEIAGFKERIFERYGIPRDARIVIFIGRKIEYKGLEKLIEAMRGIKKEIPSRLFLIGPSFPWFEDYYSRLSEDDKKEIIDFGAVNDDVKINLLRMSHLLVLPSMHEAFGIVFLEAWACGVPVVGSNTGAVPTVIQDCGLVFNCDNIEDLRIKIKRLLMDEELSRGLAAKGMEKLLANYTWDKKGREILDVYMSMNKVLFSCLRFHEKFDIRSCLREGWYEIENNGNRDFVWSKKEASLSFKENNQGVVLDVSGFTVGIKDPLTLVVHDLDGGSRIGVYDIVNNVAIIVNIPPGILNIKLSVSEARQPMAVIGSKDERFLGICLLGISETSPLGEICVNAPSVFEIETSTLCNINPPCVMCEERVKGLIGMKNSSIPFSIIKRMKPYLRNAHTVSLHGQGEPLLCANLLDIMDILNGKGIYIKFNTNGLLLKKEVSASLIKRGLREISVSMDAATSKTYEKIRRNKSFDIIKNNIKDMAELKNNNKLDYPFIELNMTIMKENLNEALGFVDLAREIGAQAVYYRLLKPVPENYAVKAGGFCFDYMAQMVDSDSDIFKRVMLETKEKSIRSGIEFRSDERGIINAVSASV